MEPAATRPDWGDSDPELSPQSAKAGTDQPSPRDLALMAAADPRFKIVYFFPHPRQDFREASLFGWYTPGILATAGPMMRACSLPADLREAHSDREDVLLHRLYGAIWPHLLPVEIDSLADALGILPSPFLVCITTDADVADRCDSTFKQHPVSVLHVSAVPGTGRKSPQNLSLEGVCEHVRNVLYELRTQPEQAQFVRECWRQLSAAPQRKLRKHALPLGLHNVTAPNEIALSAFGYKFPKAKAVAAPISTIETASSDNYVTRICQGADAVAAERTKLLGGKNPMLCDHRAIVTVGSSYARLYSTWQDLVQRVPDDKRRDLRHALSMVVRSNSYLHSMPIGDNGKPALGPASEIVAHELAQDMRAFTAGLSMLSSATLCPVLRLEPRLNQARADAAELARCVRAQAGPHYRWKQARMLRLLGKKMRTLVHPDFLERIDAKETGRIEGLKLITDLPLELMPSNGMPLGLRFDTSRTSPLPGNMFWQLCNLPPVRIPAEAFFDILIVRSFSTADPIRQHLERALGVIADPGGFKRVRYRFVDVETIDQFVEAINGFKGAVMIFDGHGRYDGELGIGCLIVGGKPLDTWALKRRCQMPPVVMFSACDTQPIEGNHGSVATSAFALGARAVLGTMFPVNAFHASIMMARMLLRIDQFMPIARSLFPILNWRHVASGMLRMSHTVEAARALNACAQLGLSTDALSRIQLKANEEINSWLPNWFDAWILAIAKETSRSADEILVLMERQVGITDAMKYVQLGNPERVIIH